MSDPDRWPAVRSDEDSRPTQCDTVMEMVTEGVCRLDRRGRIIATNDAFCRDVGYSREDLLGNEFTSVVGERDRVPFQAALDRSCQGGRTTLRRVSVESADGTTLRRELQVDDANARRGDESVVVVREPDENDRDATETDATVFSSIPASMGYRRHDESDRPMEFVGDGCVELTGYEPETLESGAVSWGSDVVHPDDYNRIREEMRAGLTERGQFTVAYRIRTADGTAREVLECGHTVDGPDDKSTFVTGTITDISHHRRSEEPLAESDTEADGEISELVRQQRATVELGTHALGESDLDALFDRAAELVSQTLDADYCRVLEHDSERETLRLRSRRGYRAKGVVEATVDVSRTSQEGFALHSEKPVVVEDFATERRFDTPELLADREVASGISVAVGPTYEPWGILSVHDADQRTFTEHDIRFVQSIANVLASAVTRTAPEQTLERHRERLAALNNLNGVIREIYTALVQQSTREEIEQLVCELLADSGSYEFAWIGEANLHDDYVEMRTRAGADKYLDEVSIALDDADSGPTARAIRTGEMQVVRDAESDADGDRYAGQNSEYDYRAVAAIPISHEETLYGVLNVYSNRAYAFDGEERDVIGQLGEMTGHAIAAVERKRALMSDEVVEVGFRLHDMLGSLDVPTSDGTIRFERAVPVGEGTYIEYGIATADMVETLLALPEVVEYWEGVNIISETDDEVRFEVRISQPPLTSVMASKGSRIKESVIEGTDYYLVVQIPQGGNVRSVVEAVKKEYPAAEFVSQRQVEEPDHSPQRFRQEVFDELTRRQRTVIESAYFSDYFSWPRESTGEEIAASLDISAATFHQHLRKAEETILKMLLKDQTVSE